ncbi:YTDC2 helicase, partial [Ceuthmochares aereus]|nr:YTDC2 helicase [Ceuthmochares aereus]
FYKDCSDSESEDTTTTHLALLKLDERLHLKLDLEASGLLLQLRQKWQSLFLRRVRAPSRPWSQSDETTIRAIVAVSCAEERAAGLQQPSGASQRPRSMSPELLLSSPWRPTSSTKSSADTELSDDSSNAEKVFMKSLPPPLHHPKNHKEKNLLHCKQTSGDGSDQPSMKSTDNRSCPDPCATLCSPVSEK